MARTRHSVARPGNFSVLEMVSAFPGHHYVMAGMTVPMAVTSYLPLALARTIRIVRTPDPESMNPAK